MLPEPAGDLVATVRVGAHVVAEADVPSLERLAREPIEARFPASLVTASPYVVEAVVALDREPLAAVRARGYTIDGVRALAERLDAAAALAQAVPSAAAYARLQADKVVLSLGRPGGPTDPEALSRDIVEAERALADAAAGRDFQAGKTGALERAYVSEIDGSAQPYLVYVPSACVEGSGAWPLVVYLHGYVPSYDKDAWVRPDPGFNAVMEAEGCILAVPFGRSNTDFLHVGEDDVMRVIEEMKGAYPVDESRIVLYGYSMGGSGVWTMLAHYPGVFSAAVVLAGRTDYYLWHGLDRDRVPAWKRYLIDADNPICQVQNIVHTPVRVYHGDADYVVQTAQSERMVARLKELGGSAELSWVRNGSHWSLFEAVMWTREPVAWAKKHRRASEPPSFRVTSYHPRYARAWGAQACSPRRALEPVRLTFARGGDGGAELCASNTECVAVWPELLGGRRPSIEQAFKVTSDDGASYSWSGRLGEDGITYYTDEWRELGLRKSERLCGPVKEAFRGPFALVVGTAGDDASDATLRAAARRFADEWREYAKGMPPILADVDVGEGVVRSKNLVLFGDRDSNAVVSRIAPALPIAWDRTSARIAGRTVGLAGRGLAFVYPNPEEPARLVVVMSGLPVGGVAPSNHKWDYLPDFIVYEDRVDPLDRMDPANEAVVAGFFDARWRLADELTFAAAAIDARPPRADPTAASPARTAE